MSPEEQPTALTEPRRYYRLDPAALESLRPAERHRQMAVTPQVRTTFAHLRHRLLRDHRIRSGSYSAAAARTGAPMTQIRSAYNCEPCNPTRTARALRPYVVVDWQALAAHASHDIPGHLSLLQELPHDISQEVVRQRCAWVDHLRAQHGTLMAVGRLLDVDSSSLTRLLARRPSPDRT